MNREVGRKEMEGMDRREKIKILTGEIGEWRKEKGLVIFYNFCILYTNLTLL